MAFDQSTRNRLQKFVSDARKLLSEEFTKQLQNTYGLDPNTGVVASLDELPGLSPSQSQTATLLRDTLEHYLATSHKSAPYEDKSLVIATLDRIVREQAFTVLNRLAALRMAESRNFVMESISQGYQSKGFQLYQRIAGSSLGETGQAYQVYLFSMFDELSLDLAVLFDRYSSQGRLFPNESMFIELLELINDTELEQLWGEDETIGWIYQFWNGRDEIDKMRSASRAPRSSREMAVRNQFFTPRYVVEFLTDNTLGRIWYEMTKGQTDLVNNCDFLVRRPNEEFLASGIALPLTETEHEKSLSQRELLQQNVFIKHRPLKDPRDIKMLDPACGSMHFGLYAFDLFEKIYQEAWELEASNSLGSFVRESVNGEMRKALHQDYENKELFLADIPRLIIENNIHGVDIDPRAAQVAGLSLWLRAHKSWADNGIKPAQRAQISRSNIVCAEPMPGESGMLSEFTSQIQPPVLGSLVETVFNKMQLAGEAGSLLKIEQEIQTAIHKARAEYIKNEQWQKGDLTLIQGTEENVDEQFWLNIESSILAELENYAEKASNQGSIQRRLFASDAAKGFAFIDLCRKRFDVVVMNPPFGDSSRDTKKYIDNVYSKSKSNLLACFIERGIEMGVQGAKIGTLVSRTGYYLSTLSGFRKHILENSQIDCHVDLGSKVLDAMVEVASSVFSKGKNSDSPSPFIRLLVKKEKEELLHREVNSLSNGSISDCTFMVPQSQFEIIDSAPFIYWIPIKVAKKIAKHKPIEPSKAEIRVGLQTSNDFRFLRLWWEVPSEKVMVPDESLAAQECRDECLEKVDSDGTWCYYSKIDKASALAAPIHLLVNWGRDGKEIKAYHQGNGDSPSRYVRSETSYFMPGFSYMLRSSRLVPYCVPRGVIPTAGRSQIYPSTGYENEVLAIASSNLASAVARFKGENFGQPKFQNSMVASIPYSNIDEANLEKIRNKVNEGFVASESKFQQDETAIQFNGFLPKQEGGEVKLDRSSLLGRDAEIAIAKSYGLDESELSLLELDMMESINSPKWISENENEPDISSKGTSYSEIFLSWAFGVAMGRFDINSYHNIKKETFVDDPFSPIPSKSPAMLAVDKPKFHKFDGILVEDPAHEHDIVTLINDVLSAIDEYCDVDINKWLKKSFFKTHLREYSKSKRQAPIYWPIQTVSGSYRLWLYYPELTNQTLYSCINDFVEPKLLQTTDELYQLRQKQNRTPDEDKDFSSLVAFEIELKDLRDELLLIAQYWKPNLNDGVQITAAPLWSLFQHKPWQNKLKKTWQELDKEKYDWSHMAFNVWPERVLKKCHQDRSFSVAHGVEDDLWHEVEVPANRGKGTKLEWQPKKLTPQEYSSFVQKQLARLKES